MTEHRKFQYEFGKNSEFLHWKISFLRLPPLSCEKRTLIRHILRLFTEKSRHFCALLRNAARKCTSTQFLHFGLTKCFSSWIDRATVRFRKSDRPQPRKSRKVLRMRPSCGGSASIHICTKGFICHVKQHSAQRSKISHRPVRCLKQTVHRVAVKQSAKRLTQRRILRRIRRSAYELDRPLVMNCSRV